MAFVLPPFGGGQPAAAIAQPALPVFAVPTDQNVTDATSYAVKVFESYKNSGNASANDVANSIDLLFSEARERIPVVGVGVPGVVPPPVVIPPPLVMPPPVVMPPPLVPPGGVPAWALPLFGGINALLAGQAGLTAGQAALAAGQAAQTAGLVALAAGQAALVASQAVISGKLDVISALTAKAYNGTCGEGALKNYVVVPNAGGINPPAMLPPLIHRGSIIALTPGQRGAYLMHYGLPLVGAVKVQRDNIAKAIGADTHF